MSKLARLAALLSCFTAFTAACVTTSLPKPGDIRLPPFQFRMRDFHLPSGMRVVMQEDHRSPYVAVAAVVGTGGANDPVGREGLAHFVEHLAFRAEPPPGVSVWRQLERLGAAEMNAFTERDETVYFEVVHKDVLPRLLELEGMRLLAPLQNVRQDVFDVEREVVRSELRQRGETNIEGEIFNTISAMLFQPGHVYAKPLGGTHESLSAITLQDARAFVERWYRPENMTLVIAGDVDLATGDRLLSAHLPTAVLGDAAHPVKLASQRISDERKEPPPMPEAKSRRMAASLATVTRPEVWIGWTLPGGFREVNALEELLLRTSLDVVLQAYLDDPEREISGVSVFPVSGTEASMLLCRVQLREGADPEISADHVLNQVFRIGFEADDEDRLFSIRMQNRIRWLSLAYHAFGSENLSARTIATAELTHFAGSPTLYTSFLKAMMETPPHRIGDLATKYLSRDRARVLYVLPVQGARPQQLAKTGVGGAVEEAETSSVAHAPPVPVASMFPPVGSSPSKQFTLENGLEVRLESWRPGLSVMAGLLFFGGRVSEVHPGESLAEPRVTVRHAWYRGNDFEYGSAQYRHAAPDYSWWLYRAPAGNLANALAMLSESVESYEVDHARWAALKDHEVSALKSEDELPERRSERAFRAALFGQNAYGHMSTGTEVEKLGEGDVKDRLDRIYRPGNAALVVVGARDLVEAERQVREWFAGWSGKKDARVAAPAVGDLAGRTGPRYLITDHAGATQVKLTLGCVLPKTDARRDASDDVLASLVRHGLEESLRRELGVTYGVYGEATRLRGKLTELRFDSHLEAARIQPAVATIARRWAEWAGGSATPVELEAARWDVARRRGWESQTNFDRAEMLLRHVALEDPIETADRYASFLSAVAKPTIDQALKKCHEGLVVSLEGPKEALEAAVPAGWVAAE